MKYKTKNKNTFGKQVLEIVLENRNLTKHEIKEILNPTKDSIRDGMSIFGMKRAVDFFKQIYKKELVIGILPDEDVDGYTSSAILYQWLVNDLRHPIENIRVFHHIENKSHGLENEIFNEMLESEVNLFIIADSSTNDTKRQKKLLDNNKQLIILEHHNLDKKLVDGVYLVNNTINENDDNKFMAGVGVTAKFIECLGYDIDKYMDLLAIGNIADSMPMSDLQNRYYAKNGLEHLNNKLVKEFFKDINLPVIQDVSWNLANFINAIIRFGTYEERILLWKAINNSNEKVEYVKRDKTIVEQTMQEGILRIANNVKNRQNNAVKKAIKEFEKQIYGNHMEKDKCLLLINNNICEYSIGGLIATKLVGKFQRPVIIVSGEGKLVGSMRSPFDFKDMIDNSGLANSVGHNRASGFFIDEDKVKEFREYMNYELRYFKCDTIIEVDAVYDSKDIDMEMVKQIADMKELWGMGIEEPTFVIKNITLESQNIEHKKGFKGYITQFKYNNMYFKKSFSSKDTYEQMIRKDELKFGRGHRIDLTLLVKFKKDDRGFYYVDIIDFNSVKSANKYSF